MCAYQSVIYGVHILELDLDALTQWREHLGEDNLLVPVRRVAALLHGGSALPANSPITERDMECLSQPHAFMHMRTQVRTLYLYVQSPNQIRASKQVLPFH